MLLPSDASMNIHPDNTQSEFTTQFKSPVELNDKYEVALSEICYSMNISMKLGTMKIFFWDETKKLYTTIVDFSLQMSGFEPYSDFFRALNLILFEQAKNVTNKDISLLIEYHEKTQNIFSKPFTPIHGFNNRLFNLALPKNVFCSFHGRIASVLGLEENVKYNKTDHGFPYFTQLLDSIFVYTDIIEDQIVGDNVAPLLRNMATQNANFSYMTSTFDNPHYVQLKKTRLNSINMRLTDIYGENIHFNSKLSKVIIKLHFRLKNGF